MVLTRRAYHRAYLAYSASWFAIDVERLTSKVDATTLQNALANSQAVPLGGDTFLEVGAKAALEIGLVHSVLLLSYVFHELP